MNKYGSINVDLNIEYYRNEADILLQSSKVKTTGRNNFNKFIKIPVESQTNLIEYFNKTLEGTYDWNWEYFHSGEPAGLHTDYISFPNTWKLVNGEVIYDCYVIIGIIIPLEWNSKQPYTINYNKTTDIPRKLIYKKGEMRYIDNDEVFIYRNKWEYDNESLLYNPKGTEYYKEYADLKVDSVYEWKLGTAMIFDTKRWHSSSWFLKDNILPDVSIEYKRSIIGFGSVSLDKGVNNVRG